MKLPLRSFLLAAQFGAMASWAEAGAAVDVFMSPYCVCCDGWAKMMEKNGFEIRTHNVSDVPAERRKLGMPDGLASCHTAHIGAYVIEGHVPVADIERLLKEQPNALGLAVPGMVAGSPGMPTEDQTEHYDTLLVQTDGSTRIFARH